METSPQKTLSPPQKKKGRAAHFSGSVSSRQGIEALCCNSLEGDGSEAEDSDPLKKESFTTRGSIIFHESWQKESLARGSIRRATSGTSGCDRIQLSPFAQEYVGSSFLRQPFKGVVSKGKPQGRPGCVPLVRGPHQVTKW